MVESKVARPRVALIRTPLDMAIWEELAVTENAALFHSLPCTRKFWALSCPETLGFWKDPWTVASNLAEPEIKGREAAFAENAEANVINW